MLSSVLPWEWILENVLDLKEFSLPCLKELISYIPHLEYSRCSKLLQKVALRYLEEIILTRKVDPSAITLIKYILKSQGGSNLRRIHSLKESVEIDLILRVETEVVLTTVRYLDKNGGRNWEAFEHAVEAIFPESSPEACKAERRKELISIVSGDEHRDDLCEQVLRKYPLEDLLKDLLLFVESKKKLFKTKFLDQLAKDVQNGSYIPSSTSRPSEGGLSSPTYVVKDTRGEREAPQTLLPQNKAMLGNCSQLKPSLPTPFPGQPTEESVEVMKEPSADILSGRTIPSTPVSLMDGSRHKTRELQNQAGKKITSVDMVSLPEELRVEMSMSMAEVDKVARGLRGQVDELVDDITKFAVDIHKVAVNSTETTYPLANTVVVQEEQGKSPSSTRASFDKAMIRPVTEQLPDLSQRKKIKRGCLKKSRTGGETKNDEGFYENAALFIPRDINTANSVHEHVSSDELDFPVSGDGVKILKENSLYRIFKAYLRQSRLDQPVPRSSTLEVPVFKRKSSEHDSRCDICNRGGVLVNCHGCHVLVHESCLEELDMVKSVDELYWFCPCCIEEITLENLERVKAVADRARQKAAAFVLAKEKHLGECRSFSENVDGRDQLNNSAVAFSVPQESAQLKDGNKQVPAQKLAPESSALDCKEAPRTQVRKEPEGCSSPPTSQHGDKRPRVLSDVGMVSTRSKTIRSGAGNTEVERSHPVSSPSSPIAGPVRSKPMTSETVQDAPAVEETLATSTPRREFVEKDGHTNFRVHNCSKEGQASLNVGVNSSLLVGGDRSPTQDPQINMSKPGVDEGDGHDGDLEEDINRQQDDAKCSKDDQTNDHPIPVDERTPPRRGRYRGRWKIPGVRRRNLPWSESEVDVLKEGVRKFSCGGFGFQWKNILEFGYGKFDPSRTAVDLKDKWRNLCKCTDRSPSSEVSS